MSQKLFQHQIVNYTEILKWLRKILECRNQFLKRHRDVANMGSQIQISKGAHKKLEVRFCFRESRSVYDVNSFPGRVLHLPLEH